MNIDKKYGLVFCGGGGKGAYQIGVWKALNELKITAKIKSVSGASVGSLNALLFCQQNFDLALETWLSVKQEDMLYSENVTKKSLIDTELSCVFDDFGLGGNSARLKPLVSLCLLAPAFIPIFSIIAPIIKPFFKDGSFDIGTIKSLIELINYSIVKEGVFSQEKLGKIIDNILFLSSNSRKITAFAAVCRAGGIADFLKKSTVEYINLVNKTPNETREIVLASSALPIIYPARKIDNYEYFDGGWADNTPIKPLYDSGIKDIIIVYLENNKHNKLKKVFKEEDRKFPDANIIRIIPNNDFKDDFIQTITVSYEITVERIQAGYNDAIQQLSKYYE